MKFSAYVVENPRGRIYIGHTDNMEDRLKRHDGKLPIKSKSYAARQKGPWELIYEERFGTRIEAVKREQDLKSSKGREFLKQFRKQKSDRP